MSAFLISSIKFTSGVITPAAAVSPEILTTGNNTDFGKRKAAMKAAVSSYEQTRLKYEKDVLQAFREVYDATVVFQSARTNSFAKSVQEEASGKYVTLANSQYINGVINYIDVLDAQRKYLSSQIEFSEAKTRENLAVVGLYKALGGGWH